MKYTIKHACGHTAVHEMYGPVDDRERRAEWLRDRDCPDCYRKACRAQEDASPIVMHVRADGLTKDDQGRLLAEIMLTGGTYPVKDVIKSLGYYWGQPRLSIMGVGGLLSASTPPRRWLKYVSLEAIINNDKATIEALESDRQQLHATMQIDIGPFETALIGRSLDRANEGGEK